MPTPERILTLQIRIIDRESAKWIWDTHDKNETFHGIKVDTIQEGEIPDCFEERIDA